MGTPQDAQNYVLGRGELYFGKFKASTQTPDGERYLGNTPEFTMTFEGENLDHFSSDRGIREKDNSIVLDVTRSATISVDHIDLENVALFFFGSKSVLAFAGATHDGYAIADARQGYYYQLGTDDDNPSGLRGLANYAAGPPIVKIEVEDAVPTTYAEDDDWEIEMETGRLYIVPDGGIADGTDLIVNFKTGAHSVDQVISGSQAVEGSLRFLARNPAGTQVDYFMPWVKLAPNGDYPLKGDEWQVIPFNVEILRKANVEALYANGRPYTP